MIRRAAAGAARRLAPAVITALALVGGRAEAHRLDEYLEQTMIDLAPTRVVLYLSLTPGVAVAPDVLPLIDTDRDGVVSPAEERAYAEQVRRDLWLSLDGAALPLRVVEAATRFPTVDAMTKGLGTIALTLEAPIAPRGATHQLRLVNHHAAARAAYLVNCLQPRDHGVRVLSQSRSRDQASYQVELAFGATSAGPSGFRAWRWLLGLALAAGLLLMSWRKRK